MDEGCTDACVAMATREHVGVTVTYGALAVIINVMITTAVRVDIGGVMENIGHTAKLEKEVIQLCLHVLLNTAQQTPALFEC